MKDAFSFAFDGDYDIAYLRELLERLHNLRLYGRNPTGTGHSLIELKVKFGEE